MPTRNVSLTDELDRFVAEKVVAGRYANASEVMRTALRNLEQDEREYEAKMSALLVMVDAGDACDPADDIDGEECMRQLRQRIADRAATQREDRVA
jgi:antitoxin ParD1/3/4